MRTKILALGICLLWILPIAVFAEKSIILKQENAPLKITEYEASYSYYERRDRITYSAKYINMSEKKL